MKLKKILLLHGPNLNMLGTREPEVYGRRTLADLEREVSAYAGERGIDVTCFQSNSEGALIDATEDAVGRFDAIVYNPGAHTHYSYALRDAVAAIDVPVVEVHLSDVSSREAFRHTSVIAPACLAQVAGLGFEGYFRAIDVLLETEKPARLGEGYERRFPQGLAVKVAGCEQDSTGEGGSGADGEGVDAPEEGPADEDFAAPYAQDVEAADAAQLAAGRQERLRSVAKQLGVRGFFLRDTSDIRWLTGIDGVFDSERAHALLVADGAACLHTDSRYSNALRNQVLQKGLALEVSDERISHIEFAKGLMMGEGKELEGKVAFEDTVTFAEYGKLCEAFGADSLAATNGVVVGLRAVKDPSELSRLLAAQAVTDAAFVHIVAFMRPGMTEREVQIELEDYMLRHGGEGLAFGSIVATGANGADPHAVPGKTRLEAGQCVVIDFGAKAYGYCADMTRVVFLGSPDARLSDAWEVVRRANEEVEAFLKPGVTGKQAHELAERVLAEGGYAGRMGHGLGHGVGIDVHEQPVLNPRNEAALVAGNVVTVEPGIYLPGEFGMRLEDCGVVTSRGYEVFTQLGHEMVII